MKFDIGVYTTWMKIYNWILRKKCPHRSYSGPHFPAFGLNTERCGVSLHIQSECGKMQSRITPNTDAFPAFGYIFNPVKWRNKNKVKKSSKIRYYQKTCFCAIFECYYQSFVSGKKTGHFLLSPPKFGIALIITNFLTSKVLWVQSCSVTFEATHI